MAAPTSPAARPRRKRSRPCSWLLVPLLLGATVVECFLLPRAPRTPPPIARQATAIRASASGSSSSSSPSSAGSPGYVSRRGKSAGAGAGDGGRATQRRPAPPPAAAAPARPGGEEEEETWVAAFAQLQGLGTRTADDYQQAFRVCAAARRPFECFSLVRHMAKDGLPRPARLYAETAALAAELGNWVTVLDAYLVFERKEEFDGACPSTRTLVELALQACDTLGKGSRAVKVYERATKDLTPALDVRAAAASALRACFRAGAHDLGLPLARALLAQTGTYAALDLPTLNMAVSTLAKAGQGREAVAALDGMRAGRWAARPDVVTYGAAIEGLLLQHQQHGKEGSSALDEALALLEAMRAQDGLEPNAVICTMLAQACCRAGRAEAAQALLDAIPARQRDLHRVRPLWTLATREGHEAALEWLLADLERRAPGDTLAPTAYHAALCNLARLGLMEDAERLAAVVAAKGKKGSGTAAAAAAGDGLRAVPATTMTYYALVAACEKAGAHARLLGWFQAMLQAKVEPDLVRYGMALQACERLGKWSAGRALVLSMRDRGLAVEPAHWKRLFLLLGREGRGQEALDLLAEMEAAAEAEAEGKGKGKGKGKGEQQRLPIICYEATVTALARAGEGARAVAALIQFEEEKGLPLGRGAYTSAIAACRAREAPEEDPAAAAAADADTALALYARMKARAPEPPSTVTRAALLDVLVAAGRWGDAGAVAAEQEAAEADGTGEPAPAHMLGNLVLAHATRQDLKAVLRRFQPLWQRRSDPSLPLPWGVCNAALQACAREGAAEMALEVLRVMRAARAPLDVVMYGCVLTACAQAGQWRPAFQLLKEMEAAVDAAEEEGKAGAPAGPGPGPGPAAVRPNLVCYTAVITALQHGGEWRKALNVLLSMLSAPGGPAPDTQTYNAVMSACANAGEAHMALRIFQAMRVQGVHPDPVTYATAVVACWRVGDWRKAVELLSAMKTDGFAPNMITVTLVIDACDRHRQFDLAAHVFESSVVGYIRSEDYEMGSDGPGMVVDLHGYSQPVAKAAVRAGLRRLAQMWASRGRDPRLIKDFVFITGVGRHSELPFEPVLRPAMQAMLTEDFEPPLRCEMAENNPGRMVIAADALVEWLEAQQANKPSLTPADLQEGTLKLRSAGELEKSYDAFLRAAAAAAKADVDEDLQMAAGGSEGPQPL